MHGRSLVADPPDKEGAGGPGARPPVWLQPLREWINEGLQLNEIARNTDLPSKKISLQKIFGSNLTLKKRGAFGIAQNHWLSLANAKEKISENDLTLILVPPVGIGPTFRN